MERGDAGSEPIRSEEPLTMRVRGLSQNGIALCGIGFTVLSVTAAQLIAGPNGTKGDFAMALAVCFLPHVAWIAWLFVRRKRTLARLQAHDWLLCTECRYPLDDPREGSALVCPECGAIFSGPEPVRETWRRWGGS